MSDKVIVREATEQEEAAYKAGWSDALEQKVVPEDTMRALQWLADTNGKGFDGDKGKVVEWLIMIAKKNEPWIRFALDLFAQDERARTRTSKAKD